jgi:selenocysteine-specific elongation factor
LAKLLLEELARFHSANPLVAGLPKEELRAKLGEGKAHTIPSPALLNALLQDLTVREKVGIQGETVRLGGQTIQMSAEEIAARDQIAAAFEKAGLTVPSAREVLATLRLERTHAEKLLRILLKENVLHKVTEDLIFHQSALRQLREIVAQRKAKNNRLDVTAFKEMTGLSRKYAIPLLEYLDRERVTRRDGDTRIIL